MATDATSPSCNARFFLEELQRANLDALNIDEEFNALDLPIEQSFEMYRSAVRDSDSKKELEEFRVYMDGLREEARKLCPSKYESPAVYSIIHRLMEQVNESLDLMKIDRGRPMIFGSLRSGRVNGMAVAVPGTDTRIILLERGLFGFANLMCKAIALAFPLRGHRDGGLVFGVGSDELKDHIDRDPKALERFFDALCAYVVEGDPHRAEQYNPDQTIMALSSILRQSMELFILGHEVGHVLLGHLDVKPVHCALSCGQETDEILPAWKDEFAADLFGISVAVTAQLQKRLDLSLSYLGADLFFGCVDVVEKAVSVLAHGRVIEGRSTTHPPPPLRREAIRYWLNGQGGEELAEQREGALRLANLINEILEAFWAKIEPALIRMHRDGIRPAAAWHR